MNVKLDNITKITTNNNVWNINFIAEELFVTKELQNLINETTNIVFNLND